MPHVTPMWSARDDKPWRLRDFFRSPNIGTGVFQDRKTGKTQNFDTALLSFASKALKMHYWMIREIFSRNSESRFGMTTQALLSELGQ